MIKRTSHVFLLFCLTIGAFLGPVLVGNSLYPTGEDLVSYYYPAFDFYSKALHSGQSFLWFPFIFSGFPIYVSQVGGFFDPVNLFLFTVFSTDAGMHLRLALDFMLVMVFSYMSARAFGLSRTASALVGPSYLMAFHWRFLSNPVIANTLFLLPLLVFVVTKAFRDTRASWRHILLGGIGLGWALLSGYTQLIVYALALLGIIFLGKAYFEKWNARRFLTAFGAMCSLVVLGVLISLPQTIPSMQFLSQTSRAEPATYEQITLKSVALGDALLFMVPDYFYVPYVTVGRKPLFVGALWSVLALGAILLTLIPLIKRRPLTKTARTFAPIVLAFLFAFVASLKWSPLFWLLSKIPVFDLFRFPFRFMFVGAFLLSLLGAYGFDNVKMLSQSRLFRYAVYIIATAGALFVGGVALMQVLAVYGRGFITGIIFFVFDTVLRSHFGFSKSTEHYQDAINRGLDAYREFLSFTDPKIALPFISLAVGITLAVLLVRGKIQVTQFASVAFVLSVSTVLFVGMVQWHTFLPRTVWDYPNALETVGVKDTHLYRTYTFLPDIVMQAYIPPQYKLSLGEESSLREFHSTISYPNGNALIGVRSVDGYDQFEPSHTLDAMGYLGGELGAGYVVRTTEERRDSLLSHLPLFGMMGGKYIMSGVELSSPDLTLLGMPEASNLKIPFYVYENAFALPRYFLAAHTEPIGERTINTLSFGSIAEPVTYLECTDCSSSTAQSGILTLQKEENGAFEFSVLTEEPQYLVLSETNLPGWHATIDGKQVDIIRANGLYMAVEVQSGEHVVRFLYRGMLDELQVLQSLGIVE